MDLTPLDPFLESAPQVALEMVDPFLNHGDGTLSKAGSLESLLVTSSITPGSEDQYDVPRDDTRTAQSVLPDPGAKVYDLREFGAVPLDRQVCDQQIHHQQIHDLAEFGAVRLNAPDSAAKGQQRIYDLTEFGARRVG